MTERGLADTSIFIAKESGRPMDLSALPGQLAVSIITIGELRAGVLAATDTRTRDRRLSTLTSVLALNPIPIGEDVANNWAKLRLLLRDNNQRMPINDSWIAATAMSLSVPVVTQDQDFPNLADLSVVHV